jgi:hypothetical protein
MYGMESRCPFLDTHAKQEVQRIEKTPIIKVEKTGA